RATAGIDMVDAPHVTAACTFVVAASTSPGAAGGYMNFKAGAGVETFIGKAGVITNIYETATNLADDTITGGGGTTYLNFTDNSTATDATFANVTGVPTIQLGDGQTVTLGANSQAAGITDVMSFGTIGVAVDASTRTNAMSVVLGDGNDTFSAGTGTTQLLTGNGTDTVVLNSSGTVNINDYAAGTDILELDNSKFSLGTTGLLAAGQYAESTNPSAMSASPTAFGAANAGIVAIDDGAGGATLWYTADMAAATTANSTAVAHVSVNTTQLDNTQFHLHV
ncbi:MAG: hypothetical protein ACM31L_06820, partial [Actinomycetota bacterium]